MIKRVNHIAIVVADLDAALQTYRDRLGLTLAKRLVMPEQEVEIAFLPAGESMIELIRPLNETSGVARYLASRGEGLHHICLEVDSIERTLEELAERSVRLINERPIRAAEGYGIFVHPKAVHGVLIEFLEPFAPPAPSERTMDDGQ
ncbi:MAG: methylmalonyl-CoA epimerase [Anaerolineae bacterium]|nr:methylmalonyl-CoA epimerase [Anaerolineae bacterium]